jgi:hypothetical protein
MTAMYPLLAHLLALSLPVKLDAQKNPVPVLALFGLVVALWWFALAAARRRDARRAGRGRGSETWSRRPPRY